jgi:hypothetical protein
MILTKKDRKVLAFSIKETPTPKLVKARKLIKERKDGSPICEPWFTAFYLRLLNAELKHRKAMGS